LPDPGCHRTNPGDEHHAFNEAGQVTPGLADLHALCDAQAAERAEVHAHAVLDADFRVSNHGSIALLIPRSEAARIWVDEHLPADRMTWGEGVVVEPRYLQNIVDGVEADGYTVA
jgi:hypothetical protein